MKAQIQEMARPFVQHFVPVRDDRGLGSNRRGPDIAEYIESSPSRQLEKTYLKKHLATLAHEIKNPLASISLSNAYLTSEVSDPDFLLYLKIIERSAKRINDIVIALIEDVFEKKNETVLVNHFLDQTLAQFKDKFTLGGVTVEKSFCRSTCLIAVMREKFEVALNNIILNAIESLPPSGGRLQIRTYAAMGKVRITIADNGSGIAKENLDKIFQMGYTNKPGGSGIGLAVTKEILAEHQALLKVRSKQGRGTSFIIEMDLIS